jgi:CubicO group peptidase (beta-lactamase class C family)
MTSGLRFVEDYVDDSISHCIDMLFGAGQADVAGYAAALPLDHPPDSVFNYSSGTTNIVSRIVGNAVGGGEAAMRAFMEAELFGPLGMTSADPRFDAAGTFIGSSFLYCTARDFARFGQLYLGDGVWEVGGSCPRAGSTSPAPGARAVDEEFGYGATGGSGTGTASPGRCRTATRGSTSSCGPTGTSWWSASEDADRGPAAGHRAPASARRLVTATRCVRPVHCRAHRNDA